MIRNFLLSTVAVVAVSTTAFAADLPSRRAPPVYIPPPVPLFSWTGFYVGGQIGAAFGKDNAREIAVPAGAGPDVFYKVGTPTGTIGGMHIGYNFSTQSLPVIGQFAGGLSGIPFFGGFGGAGGVIGVEGDVDGTDYRSTATFGAFTNTARQQVTGSARGRLGIAVDRALFYATGGAAFGQFRQTYGVSFAGVPGFGGTQLFESFSNSRVGYTVGGGIEYAITTQFSLRGEYRYTDYGKFVNNNSAIIGAFYTTHHLYQNRVQVGFSYKFDSPMAAPVVARY